MHIPSKTAFTFVLPRLRALFRSWSIGFSDFNYHKSLKNRYSIPPFDADYEQLFRQEQQINTLKTLKTGLLLAVIYILALNSSLVLYGHYSRHEVMVCLAIMLTLVIVFLTLHRQPNLNQHINKAAKLSATLSVADLIGMLFIEGHSAFYSQVWLGLLPIYFFSYGYRFMSIAETVTLGVLTLIALALSAYLMGIDNKPLMTTLMTLFIINILGFYIRYQLEVHARIVFLERRKVALALKDHALFLRQLGHNLRQPLYALSCYASVLDAACTDKTSPHLQQLAGKLGLAVDNLNGTFNHIIDIANLESGQQTPQLGPVDINVLLTNMKNQFALQAINSGLKLNIHLRSQPPYTVYSDPHILSQIIGNLLDNAIKYTLSGWIVVAAVKIKGNRLKLHVCDSGIGIAEEFHAEIFKEFFRCQKRQTDSQSHGLGIGLAYVLKATKYLPNHHLQVSSRLHKGSDFQLYLPAISAIQAQPLNFADCFVFVVGDDQFLNTLMQALSTCGCLVQKASSKAETEAALSENFRAPDLLISQFHLNHQESAHDIIAVVQCYCGSIPTLILSAQVILETDKAKLPNNTLLLRTPVSEIILMDRMIKAMAK